MRKPATYRMFAPQWLVAEMNRLISSSDGSSIMYFRTKMLGSNPAVAYFTIVSPFSVQSRMPTGG